MSLQGGSSSMNGAAMISAATSCVVAIGVGTAVTVLTEGDAFIVGVVSTLAVVLLVASLLSGHAALTNGAVAALVLAFGLSTITEGSRTRPWAALVGVACLVVGELAWRSFVSRGETSVGPSHPSSAALAAVMAASLLLGIALQGVGSSHPTGSPTLVFAGVAAVVVAAAGIWWLARTRLSRR